MKRVFFSATMLFMLCTRSYDSSALMYINNSPNSKAKSVFEKEFPGADSITWRTMGDYTEASFLMGHFKIDAYFNAQGDLEGYGRHIPEQLLPMGIVMYVNQHFRNALRLDQLLEVSNIEGLSYWLTVVTPTDATRMHFSADGMLLKMVRIGHK